MTTVTTSQNFIGHLIGWLRSGPADEVNNFDLLPPSPPIVEEEQNTILQLIHPDLLEQNIFEIQPPQAPLQTVHETPETQEKLIPGKFDYVKDKNTQEMLVTAWEAINLTETWDFMKQDIYSYSLSSDPKVAIISDKICKLYDFHSGCSFGWTMRQMQFIAQNGEEKYMERYI